MVVADKVCKWAQQIARFHEFSTEFAMLSFVLPLKLCKSRMNQSLGNAAIVENRGLKQVIYTGFGPGTSLSNFCSNVSNSFTVVNVRNSHEVQGV
jgi:hypothetical protein